MESPNAGNPVCAGKLAAELDAEFQQQCASNPWDCTALAPLEWMLNEVVTSLQPSSDDYSRRHYVILRLSNLVQSLDSCKGGLSSPEGLRRPVLETTIIKQLHLCSV